MQFSVVVPVYNAEEYLSECIESVISQSFIDFELILVDDGSTDSSSKICDEWAEKDERIKVYHKTNSGQIDTRCFAVKQSRGNFIVFLDADDKISIDTLEIIYNTINLYGCDMVVYDFQKFSYTEDIMPGFNNASSEKMVIDDKKKLFVQMLTGNAYNAVWRKATRSDLINKMNYCDVSFLRYGEDLLQTLDIIKNNPKTVIISDKLYYYRVNPNSVTQNVNIERYVLDHLYVRNEVYKQILKEDFYTESDLSKHIENDIVLLCDVISTIAVQKITYKNKKALFKTIKMSNYYKDALNRTKVGVKKLGLKQYFKFILFKHGFWSVLICVLIIKNLF